MTNAGGPHVGEKYKVGNERRTQLLGNEGSRPVAQRLDGPADDVLKKKLGIVFIQTSATYMVSVQVLMVARRAALELCTYLG